MEAEVQVLRLDVRFLRNEIKLMLLDKATLQTILDTILKWIEEQSKNKILTSVLLYNERTLQLFNGSSAALPQTYNEAINGIKAEDGAGSCGTAAYRKQQVIVEDIATNPLWKNYKEHALKASLYACWSTPIISSHNQLLGTFAVYYKTPSKPFANDLKLVNEIADITAMAIEARQKDFEQMITV